MVRIVASPRMASLTSLHLGGRALALATFGSAADLETLPEAADRIGGRVAMLGGGTNILAADGELPVVLVRCGLDEAPAVTARTADCGSYGSARRKAARLLVWCMKHGLSGLEGMAGVRATWAARWPGMPGRTGWIWARCCAAWMCFPRTVAFGRWGVRTCAVNTVFSV